MRDKHFFKICLTFLEQIVNAKLKKNKTNTSYFFPDVDNSQRCTYPTPLTKARCDTKPIF